MAFVFEKIPVDTDKIVFYGNEETVTNGVRPYFGRVFFSAYWVADYERQAFLVPDGGGMNEDRPFRCNFVLLLKDKHYWVSVDRITKRKKTF